MKCIQFCFTHYELWDAGGGANRPAVGFPAGVSHYVKLASDMKNPPRAVMAHAFKRMGQLFAPASNRLRKLSARLVPGSAGRIVSPAICGSYQSKDRYANRARDCASGGDRAG